MRVGMKTAVILEVVVVVVVVDSTSRWRGPKNRQTCYYNGKRHVSL